MSGNPVTFPKCGACGADHQNFSFTTDASKCISCGASPAIFHGTPSTGTAGTPGTFDGGVPYDLDALVRLGVVGDPATPWTTGQHVVLGDGSTAYWDGTKWIPGIAP